MAVDEAVAVRGAQGIEDVGMKGVHARFNEGAGCDAQGVEIADRAQRRGKVDAQEVPRGLGMGEKFPEKRVVWGIWMGHDVCRNGMKVRSCLHSMLWAIRAVVFPSFIPVVASEVRQSTSRRGCHAVPHLAMTLVQRFPDLLVEQYMVGIVYLFFCIFLPDNAVLPEMSC
jgi:hypothetical protein